MLKRARFDRKGSYGAFKNTQSVATKKKQQLMAIYKQIGLMEKKFVETVVNAADPTNAGLLTYINNVAEGTDYNQRLGRKIRPIYIQYRIQWSAVAGAITSVPVHGRTIFMLDRQPNGATTTTSTLLSQPATSTVVSQFKDSQVNAERFHWFKDLTCELWTGGQSNTIQNGFIDLIKHGEKNHCDREVRFIGSSAATPNTNAYILFNGQDGTTNNLVFNAVVRFCYVDI